MTPCIVIVRIYVARRLSTFACCCDGNSHPGAAITQEVDYVIMGLTEAGAHRYWSGWGWVADINEAQTFNEQILAENELNILAFRMAFKGKYKIEQNEQGWYIVSLACHESLYLYDVYYKDNVADRLCWISSKAHCLSHKTLGEVFSLLVKLP